MAKRTGISVADFERAFDEFFDEMLISRWRRAADSGDLEHSQVIEGPEHYEMRIAVPNADPNLIEVEVSGQRLLVRAPGPDGTFERSYSFAVPIEDAAVQARWSDHTLVIVVPKQKPKRIKVND
jgi:HSP20 family molecular chaperone IbpA